MPYCRLNSALAIEEGMEVARLVSDGRSFRQAAKALGMSTTTAWRRYWLVMDWSTPRLHGRRPGRLPPQRGTERWKREGWGRAAAGW